MSRNNITFNGNNYREVEALSYSALSLYDKDMKSFYKKFILKEEDAEEESQFVRMGRLVDIKMTDPDNFDNLFLITTATKPTGQLLTLTDFLFGLWKDNETSSFEDIFNQSYRLLEESNGGKVRDKVETFVKNFNEKASPYFQELIKARGKTVVTIEEATMADEIVSKINNTEAFAKKGDIKLSKVPLFFKINGVDFKCEVDEMDICTKNKEIFPNDYKMSSFINEFVASGYIKNNYYLQGGVYKYGIEYCLGEGVLKDFKEYKVHPLSFKVADQTNYFDPLLYKTTEQHFNDSFEGFYFGRSYNKGIFRLMEEIKMSTENDIWRMSIDNYNKNGEVLVPSFKQTLDEL
jgi:hypothetical protein